MKKSKKMLGVLLAALLTIISIPTVSADIIGASPGTILNTLPKDAEICKTLGVMQGDGKGNFTAEYLRNDTQRIQAAITLLKLTGKYVEATAFTGTTNFKDANQVAPSDDKKLLAYLKAHPELGFGGYTNGNFGIQDPISAQQFYKVLLTALGYKPGSDFTWSEVNTFAASKGLTKVAQKDSLTIGDLATATVEGLKAKVKDSDKTLADALIASGADRGKFEAAGLVSPIAPPPPPVVTPPTPVDTLPTPTNPQQQQQQQQTNPQQPVGD